MSDDPRIPAASLDGVDFQKLHRFSPASAEEILRIGGLLERGEENEEDFVKLCRLLYEAGEINKSEELLRCNMPSGNGRIYDLYIKLHGRHAETLYQVAIDGFKKQFLVELCLIKRFKYLREEYYASSLSRSNLDIHFPLTSSVTFSFEGRGIVLADVVDLGDGAQTEGNKDPDYVIWQWFDNVWRTSQSEEKIW